MIRIALSLALALVWLHAPVPAEGGYARQATKGPAGHWIGSLAVGPGLEIIVDLAMKGGVWYGTISIPAQGTKGAPLADASFKDNALAFAIKGAPGDPRYAGKLSDDGKTIAGDFVQGGSALPLTLAWKGEPQFEVPQKSTPVTKEFVGSWEGTLDAKGTMLRLQLQIANSANGATGKMISLDQNNVEIPISTIAQDGQRLKLTLNMISGAFSGELKGDEIAGTWTQGPLSLPLAFKRMKK